MIYDNKAFERYVGMKILHIMTGANYEVIKTFISFVNDYYKKEEHDFLIIDSRKKVPLEIQNHSNVTVFGIGQENFRKKLLERMLPYDKILLHSLGFDYKMQFMILIHPHLMKKIIWISWGRDSYEWKGKGFKRN
jgi:hypothetical protein